MIKASCGPFLLLSPSQRIFLRICSISYSRPQYGISNLGAQSIRKDPNVQVQSMVRTLFLGAQSLPSASAIEDFSPKQLRKLVLVDIYDSTTLCHYLAQYPHSCPELEDLEFHAIPEWDIFFIMLERRNLFKYPVSPSEVYQNTPKMSTLPSSTHSPTTSTPITAAAELLRALSTYSAESFTGHEYVSAFPNSDESIDTGQNGLC
jgi:hypothetical protein